MLIKALSSYINDEYIQLNQPVTSIEDHQDSLLVSTNSEIFYCKQLITTIPPHLLTKSIKFTPHLPINLLDITNNTHTWMGDSIKIGLTYSKPFWKAKETSGTIFSNAGPITEMYDHSNKDDSLFALKGFFNGSYHLLSRDERLNMVLKQLKSYYGDAVNDYLSYEEMVWKQEIFTSTEYNNTIIPHQNNGHKVFQQTYFNGKLFLSGSETSLTHAGYMEGAIKSAQLLIEKLLVKG
jgi:monoamine oxidase